MPLTRSSRFPFGAGDLALDLTFVSLPSRSLATDGKPLALIRDPLTLIRELFALARLLVHRLDHHSSPDLSSEFVGSA
jgi:hypothetical protein